MVLPFAAPLVLATGTEDTAVDFDRGETAAMPLERSAAMISIDATDSAGGAGEVLLDHFFADADRFENLGAR